MASYTSTHCSLGVCTSCSCTGSIESYCTDNLQEALDTPVPWIGMYIAAASAACAIAMAADAINGFRRKKLWFPSKYFTLNAFSLTVVAVAMKLPVDLTSKMEGDIDKTVRITSLVLMSTVITNFMPSLGSMENNEILLNLAALGILVITITGNVFIRVFQSNLYLGFIGDGYVYETGCIVFLLTLLVLLCSSALMVPTAKGYIESQYNQMRKIVLNYEQVSHIGKYRNNELRAAVRKYWVMVESGNPQFVIARSVTCVASDVMCLSLGIMMLAIVHTSINLKYYYNWKTSSNYKWSIKWILVSQYIGVTLGIISSLLRCLTVAQFKSTKIGHKSFKDEFTVEAYWTQTLRQWRDSPLPLRHGHHRKFRRILHDAKKLLLNLYIADQIFIVLTSKLCFLISVIIVKGFLFCFSHIKGFVKANIYSEDITRGFEIRADQMEREDSSQYVLLLEGEELPKWMLKNVCNEVDKLIRKGKKKQSQNLIQLLQKSVNFNGVREFDSSEIQSLHSHGEPPICWTLPVVTLTSIAVSLPDITDQMSDQLLSAVSEGLYFVKLIEKTLDSDGKLASIRDAADVVWVRAELYKKWQGKDLKAAGRTHKEMLQKLSGIAEKTVECFSKDTANVLVQDPLNWPAKVIAANSMYRITQTLMLAHKDENDQTNDAELFERLSVMISDILSACLTNLARVIILKCHSNAIKEREKSVGQAALLLGESEEILEIIQQRELPPNVDPEKGGNIEGWRAFMEMENGSPVASASATLPQTNGEHVSIELAR